MKGRWLSFPRSSERGPIEASRRPAAIRSSSNFRAHLSAAPLKQHAARLDDFLAVEFPRSSERGPIEARFLPAIWEWFSRHFRAHLSAAPLKQRRDPAARRARLISALI